MSIYVSAPYHMARRWALSQNEVSGRPLPVDVRDEGEGYVLTAYVPGLKAEDLNIQIVEDALSIEGKYVEREGEALLSELPTGAFRRTLRLPGELDAEKAEANIENGVLTLRLPKAESVRPKSIKVVSK